MKKERIYAFDFMRSITAFIIIVYHFACMCNSTPQYANFPYFSSYANGVWGENTSVNIFFMLSGASLFYNYPDLKLGSLKKYYFDRFKGIFPLFYLIWFFLYYQKATLMGGLFYNGSPKTLLLTLFGMDGYLSYRYPQNYYFIGEWFLGALVFLYLLYPVLTWCMKHCKVFTTLLLGFGTLAFHWELPFFQIQRERNLIVCLFAFWLGMLFIQYRKSLSSKWLLIPFGGIALFLIFVKVPLDSFLCAQIVPIGLFLIFYHIGNVLQKFSPLTKFFAHTSKLSYAIFLLQHVVMGQVMGIFGQNGLKALLVWQEVLILAVTLVTIYFFAELSTHLIQQFFKSRLFQKVQGYFYS